MAFVIGIDTGGTFTDCVLLADAEIHHAKVPSTPDDFARGVRDGLEHLASELEVPVEKLVEQIDHFFHGTTIATNIMVQHSGAKAGLLTTAGFRDIIFIQRGIGRVTGVPPEEVTRISSTHKPQPIVPKRMIGEVFERVDCRGDVVVELNEEQCRSEISRLIEQGVESIAISFLWSFRNPSHEIRAEELVHELAPDLFVTRSSALAPKSGEYERTTTVAINAYVGPETQRYLRRLEQGLNELGLSHPLLVMTASGGVVSADDAGRSAVSTIGSGPTGGVIGAAALAERSGWSNVIATDMGGTSFEVGLIIDGVSPRLPTSIVSQYEYYNSSLAIHSIGAGGGSVAWIDSTGRLRVGPRSAGATPGPACYGRGGSEPTVTDADLLLGYLSDEYFLGGKMQLDRAAAEKAIRKIAEPLEMTLPEAASGITKISEFAMADLIRKHTVQQGRDPRDFVVFAYGGAGPVHAGVFAAELGVQSVVIPIGDLASLWSAFGVAEADILHVIEQSELMTEPLSSGQLRVQFDRLAHQARVLLRKDGVNEDAISLELSVDMRHRAQVHVVAVEVLASDLDAPSAATLIERFEDKYESLYGHGAALRDAGVELLTLRVHGRGRVRRSENMGGSREGGAVFEPVTERQVYWPSLANAVATPVYRGERFRAGASLDGPAVVELPDTTVVVHPGQRLDVDDLGTLILTLEQQPGSGPDRVSAGSAADQPRASAAKQ